jgi:transposase
MHQYHVGIDLHKTVLQACVLGAHGEPCQERRFRIEDLAAGEAALEWLAPYMAQGHLAVEALGCNRWFVNACRTRGWDVIVANAAKLALKQDGRKTDRHDAEEIARRLYLGDIPRKARTYYPTEAEYGLRRLLRIRHSQVEKRTHTQAEIRSILDAYKITPPLAPLRSLRSLRAIAWLRTVEMPTPALRVALDVLVDDLESVQRRVESLNRTLKECLAKDERAQMLAGGLPGVAAQTVLTIQAELGDAHRFRRARAVASYAGLAPRVTASADKAHHGSVTKHGNAHLRWIVGQWAVRLLVHNEVAQAWALPRLRRVHKNKLRVALARKLLIGVWWTLTRGEVFSLERCLGLKRGA